MQDQNTSGAPAGQGSSVGRFVVTSVVEGVAEDVDTFFRYIGGIIDHFRLKFASHGSVGPLPSDDDRTKLPTLPAFQPPVGAAPVVPSVDQVRAAIASAHTLFGSIIDMAKLAGTETYPLIGKMVMDVEGYAGAALGFFHSAPPATPTVSQAPSALEAPTASPPPVVADVPPAGTSASVPADAVAPLAAPPEPAPVAPEVSARPR